MTNRPQHVPRVLLIRCLAHTIIALEIRVWPALVVDEIAVLMEPLKKRRFMRIVTRLACQNFEAIGEVIQRLANRPPDGMLGVWVISGVVAVEEYRITTQRAFVAINYQPVFVQVRLQNSL